MKRTPATSDASADIVPLFEFTKVVNSTLDLPFILGTLLLTIMGRLMVGKAAVLLRRPDGTFCVEYGKGVRPNLLGTSFTITRSAPTAFAVPDAALYAPLRNNGIARLFPIRSRDDVIGYCGVGANPRMPMTADHVRFIETLINISAAAIEKGMAFDALKDVNRQLDGRVQQLKTLFELGKDFSGILEREQLVRLFTLTLMGQVGTNRFAICLKEGESIFSRIPAEALEPAREEICSLVDAPLLASEVPAGKPYTRLRRLLAEERISALVPLQMQSEVKGVLCLGDRLRGGPYTASDLEYIYSLANLAFVSLENVRLFTDAVERKRLENELLIAREIQQRLLPREVPAVPSFDIAASNISSKQVGGDYYDIVPAPEGEFLLVIADVSGKGTPASLLMANLQATVHALVPFALELPAATARINDLIYRNTGTDKFITFFWGALAPATRRFRYVNAGHNHPFLLRADGTVERLSDGGIILGIMPSLVPYAQGTVELRSGDTMVLFTDGVSEAMNAEGNDYTEERLERFLRSVSGKSASETHAAVVAEIQAYSAGAPQSDDITLMVVKAL